MHHNTTGMNEPFLEHEPKRYCWGRLSRGWYCLVVSAIVAILLLVLILISIFVIGRNIAQSQLDNSSITVKMTLSNPTDTTMEVHVQGSLDNRGSLSATLKKTDIDLIYMGQKFGTMVFPEMTAAGGGLTTLDVKSLIAVTHQDNFDRFGRDLLAQDEVTVQMSAKITAKAMGITYSDLDFSKFVELKGFSNLANPMPSILKQSVDQGLENTIIMHLTVKIFNPADVSFGNIGRLNLSMLYNDVVLGYAIADDDVQMNFGENVLNQTAYIVRTPENEDTISQVLSAYTNGETLYLSLHGNEYSSPFKILAAALGSVQAPVPFVGLVHKEDKLFQAAYQAINPMKLAVSEEFCNFTATHTYMTARAFVYNPLNVTQTVDKVNVTALWHPDQQWPDYNATTDYTFAWSRAHDMGLVIPPFGTIVYSQNLCIAGSIMGEVLKYLSWLKIDFTGEIPFPLYTTIGGEIVAAAGDFKGARLNYKQDLMIVARFSLT